MPGDEYVRGYRKSTAPVWCDALDLRDEIDTAVRAWHPGGGSTPTRLRGLAARGWRPQDTPAIEQISGNLEAWVGQIDALLSDERPKNVLGK